MKKYRNGKSGKVTNAWQKMLNAKRENEKRQEINEAKREYARIIAEMEAEKIKAEKEAVEKTASELTAPKETAIETTV